MDMYVINFAMNPFNKDVVVTKDMSLVIVRYKEIIFIVSNFWLNTVNKSRPNKTEMNVKPKYYELSFNFLLKLVEVLEFKWWHSCNLSLNGC